MPRPRKNPRSIEDIMAADIISVHGEAHRKYPDSSPAQIYRLAKEGRIQLIEGPTKKLRCSHYEAQMEAGFPVMSSQAGQAA
jgi:hypothetical protein